MKTWRTYPIPLSSRCFIFALLLFAISCKKSDDRRCFKSTGDYTEIEIPLDSVNQFNLYKNLRYQIVQDNQKKVLIKGGKNVVNFVELNQENYVVSISNLNGCNFLRKSEDIIEVEIHYPYLKQFYIEPSDSVIFENTIIEDSLLIEIRDGGGSARIDVDVNYLSINVTHGTADYTLSGYADNAEVKIQNNGFADASKFNAGYIFLYQNSTADLKINLENSMGIVLIDGTGSVRYSGSNFTINLITKGSGKFIEI